MYINSSEFTDIKKELRIYNLYPYVIDTVDIYYICSDLYLYNDLFSLNDDGQPKLVLNIDGNKYPLQLGSPGESPKHPIKYKKSVAQAKVLFTQPNTLDNKRIPAFVGSSQFDNWTVGTNFNDVDDYISITIEANSFPTLATTRYGYGRSNNLQTQDNPLGQYGYGKNEGKQIAYGGCGDDFLFKAGAIIVEVSDQKANNYLYSSEIIAKTSKGEYGWGESSWGGLIDGAQEGYGGITY